MRRECGLERLGVSWSRPRYTWGTLMRFLMRPTTIIAFEQRLYRLDSINDTLFATK